MSRRTTKARRAARRRETDVRILGLDLPAFSSLSHYDPWGKPCGLGTFARWMETNGPERILGQELLPNGYVVSTVWLGLDHSFGRARQPVIYESMVFGPSSRGRHLGSSLDQRRYSSRGQAREGHRALVEAWGKRPKLSIVPDPSGEAPR